MTMNLEEPVAAPTASGEVVVSSVRSLESRALKGTYFIVLSYGLALGLRLLSSVVLSRLFNPEYFGLLALVTTVIVGMNLFSHLGLEENVIQHPRGDEPTFLNTAWTLQVLRGSGLWLLTIPLAWPIAKFYHEPRMLALLPVLGFGCLIAGVSSPSLLTLSRHMGVARLSSLELIGQATYFVVTLIWAWFQPTIWALAGGRIASELVRSALSYTMLPEIRPHFRWERDAVRSLVVFGRWILIGTALTFLATQSDRLILGKLVSFRMLGIYGVAFALSDLPRQIIAQFCYRVGYPFIAKFSARPRKEFRRTLRKYRMLVLMAGGLMLIFVICTGDQFILHVYDKRYHEAAAMIGLFAIGLWHTLLYSTITPAILSLQKPHWNALANLLYCVALFVSLPLGFHFFGIYGAVLAVAFSDLPVYFVSLYGAAKEGVGVLSQDIWMTFVFATALILTLLLRRSLGFGLPFPHF